jgi:hypothetical protein
MKPRQKNPHAVALGKLGAKKSARKAGEARWKGVSKEERSRIAKRAIAARWSGREKTKRAK